MTAEPTSLGEITERFTVSIDHQVALKSARRRLVEEFANTFNESTVERFLAGSYSQYATAARFPHYVHILAERFARQRLDAFVKAEDYLDAGRPIVLFICKANDLHSPMARGLFARRAGADALAWSAGISPAVNLHPEVEPVMKAAGISLLEEFPKPIALEMLNAATTIVTFGCADSVTRVPGRSYFEVGAPSPDTGGVRSVEALKDWLDAGMANLYEHLFSPKRPNATEPSAPVHQPVTSAM